MTTSDQNAEQWAAILRNGPYVLRQHERETIADLLDSYRRANQKAEREIAKLKRELGEWHQVAETTIEALLGEPDK